MKAKTMTLMTEAELDERYTPEAALKLSIEKWERAIRKENWETLKEDTWEYLEARTCALCLKYSIPRFCGDDDNHCPLAEKDDDRDVWFGCVDGSPFSRVWDAIEESWNRLEFLEAANELLGILREAFQESEKGNRQ